MNIGKSIIFSGIFLTIVGICIYLFQYKFTWFGNLFGDFKYEKNNIKVFFPFGSMILVSIFFSLLLALFLKLFK